MRPHGEKGTEVTILRYNRGVGGGWLVLMGAHLEFPD